MAREGVIREGEELSPPSSLSAITLPLTGSQRGPLCPIPKARVTTMKQATQDSVGYRDTQGGGPPSSALAWGLYQVYLAAASQHDPMWS